MKTKWTPRLTLCVCFLEQRSSSCDSAVVEGIQTEMREPFHTWQQRRRPRKDENDVCRAGSSGNSHPGKAEFMHPFCDPVNGRPEIDLYSLHFLNCAEFATRLSTKAKRKCSRQRLSHAPAAGTSEPGSWQMLASAGILIRSHRTRSCTGNSELTSSHLPQTHTHTHQV